MNLVPARLPLQEVEVLLTPATIRTLSLMPSALRFILTSCRLCLTHGAMPFHYSSGVSSHNSACMLREEQRERGRKRARV